MTGGACKIPKERKRRKKKKAGDGGGAGAGAGDGDASTQVTYLREGEQQDFTVVVGRFGLDAEVD